MSAPLTESWWVVAQAGTYTEFFTQAAGQQPRMQLAKSVYYADLSMYGDRPGKRQSAFGTARHD